MDIGEMVMTDETAVSIADRFISVQTCDEGYDYSIMDGEYRLLDGGIYDDPDMSIEDVLAELIEDLKFFSDEKLKGSIKADDEAYPVDYDELMGKAESVELEVLRQTRIVPDFKEKTKELFHNIKGQTPDDIESTVFAHVMAVLDEYEADAQIVDIAVYGSRCRGLEREDSDLDVVVEYKGSEKEDHMFNILNEDGLRIGGVRVDINPITEHSSGTMSTYLFSAEKYLTEEYNSIPDSL